MKRIVTKAKAAHQLREDVDPDIVFDMIVGTVVFRTMFSSTDKPSDFVDRLTDHKCRGLLPAQ